MEKLLPKILIYPIILICAFAAFAQFGYLESWISDPNNSVRNENLAGILLIGLFSSFAWIGILILVKTKSSMFSKIDRIIAILSGVTVGLFTLLAVVLDLAI